MAQPVTTLNKEATDDARWFKNGAGGITDAKGA